MRIGARSSLAAVARVAGAVGAALAATVLGSGRRRAALEPAVGVPACTNKFQ